MKKDDSSRRGCYPLSWKENTKTKVRKIRDVGRWWQEAGQLWSNVFLPQEKPRGYLLKLRTGSDSSFGKYENSSKAAVLEEVGCLGDFTHRLVCLAWLVRTKGPSQLL